MGPFRIARLPDKSKGLIKLLDWTVEAPAMAADCPDFPPIFQDKIRKSFYCSAIEH